MDLVECFTALRSNEEAYQVLLSKYKTEEDTRMRRDSSRHDFEPIHRVTSATSSAASPNGSSSDVSTPMSHYQQPSMPPHVPSSTSSLSSLLQSAKMVAEISSTPQKLEETNNKQLFNIPILPNSNLPTGWDSVTSPSMFLTQLPNFHLLPQYGNNTLVVRGMLHELTNYGKCYAGINISPTPSPASDVLAHVVYRLDQFRVTDAVNRGTYKRSYVQGVKKNGRWYSVTKTFQQNDLIVPNTLFWWRIVFHEEGFYSFVDGNLISFTEMDRDVLQQVTSPPALPQNVPSAFPPAQLPPCLYVSLPLAAESGEKSLWKVASMHWGSSSVDPLVRQSNVAKLTKPLAPAASAPSVMSRPGTKINITGVPSNASDLNLKTLFSKFGPVVSVRQYQAGAFLLEFANPESASEALSAPANSHQLFGVSILVGKAS
jgi:RNA recognition motif. (a.k.a. RRM, RBD, or RNP domain)